MKVEWAVRDETKEAKEEKLILRITNARLEIFSGSCSLLSTLFKLKLNRKHQTKKKEMREVDVGGGVLMSVISEHGRSRVSQQLK